MDNPIAAATIARLASLALEEKKEFKTYVNPDLTEAEEKSVAFVVGDFGFEIFTSPEKLVYYFDGAEVSEEQWSQLLDG